MYSLLDTVSRYLQRLEILLAAGSLLLLLLLAVAQILIRNLLDFGYPEIDIINRHLLVICGLSGAALAAARGTHIKTDALNILLPETVRRRLSTPLYLFAAAVCFALGHYAGVFVMDEWQYTPVNERWTLPFLLIYPLSFSLMALHFLIHAMTGGEYRQ